MQEKHFVILSIKVNTSAVITIGFSATRMASNTDTIAKLRDICSTEHNRHFWQQQFALKKQHENETADNWLCELRSLARKCEFATDCCADCVLRAYFSLGGAQCFRR